MKTKSCIWPLGFLLAAALAAHAITTSGPITDSETWSGTVHLTGDVTVTSTGSLTILPGTRVKCDSRSDDQIGGINTSRIELIVDKGVLTALGTQANPILFNLTKIYDSRDNASVGQVVIHTWSDTILHPWPPSIESQPQSQSFVPGVTVRFGVVAVGSPPLGYQWRKNEAVLANGGNVSGVDTPTLTLANVQITDTGGYSVVVSNVAGPVPSQVAVLTVEPVMEAAVWLISLTGWNRDVVWENSSASWAEPIDNSSGPIANSRDHRALPRAPRDGVWSGLCSGWSRAGDRRE